ncbi:plasmid pRiA4b ORF-3 family protein [Chondrinema litorale]|uniref:plasmid pRiA4b ORF-3 family protein n=1 Tax=Chondrinema litorale TaxID=2994555 RepID=UPI002542A3E4|nr:plasmid pRiA4b ORF-3 family protein [Chondrinema litorale]UZR96987.1 plasmid pRiA4b ORF-3 family protein [Chondrinema litorale]
MNKEELKIEIENLQIQDDFSDFINYISTNNVKLTAQANHIGPKDCFAINNLLYHKQAVKHNKLKHPKYHAIWLFFQLGLTSGLLEIDDQKSSNYLKVNEEKFSYFMSFNKVEKYLMLLETLWVKCCLENLNPDGRGPDFQENLNDFFESLEESLPNKNEPNNLFYSHYNDVIIQLPFFGWWDYSLKKDTTYYDIVEEVDISLLGEFFIKKLKAERPLLFWNKHSRINKSYLFETTFMMFQYERTDLSEEDINKLLDRVSKESFLDVFTDNFEEGILDKKNFYSSNTQDNNYIFKVALTKKIWRKIKISSLATFEDLHIAIMQAFNFDNDHLYAFFLSGTVYKGDSLKDPRREEAPFADEVEIKEADLQNGDKIAYLFDYIAGWQFLLKLEEIETNTTPLSKPQIVDTKGEAPEQYPDWEE